jgi:hypothetical protein
MDPETDRFVAQELKTVVDGLRKKIVDLETAAEKEKKDKEATGKTGINTWILVALIVIVLFAMFAGPGPR